MLQKTWECRYRYEVVILHSLGLYAEEGLLGHVVYFNWGHMVIF